MKKLKYVTRLSDYMKTKYFLSILFLLMITFSTGVIAKQTPHYIDYLATNMIQICDGEMYDGIPLTFDKAKSIIQEYDKHPEESMIIAGGWNGFEVFRCGNKALLTYKSGEYFINGFKIDAETYNYVFQIVQDVINSQVAQSIYGNSIAIEGEDNTIAQGENAVAESTNWFSKNNITISNIIFNIGLYITLSISFYVIYKIFIKFKPRKKQESPIKNID